MALRKGFILVWMNGGTLITFENVDGTSILPVFTSETSLGAVHGRIPIPPDGVLVRFEVWADAAGSFKQATNGGGLKDLQLDWSRLRAMWDTEPEFQRELERGLAQMKARSPGPA
jgi:hypothetical protein